jgi:hypothetical protein
MQLARTGYSGVPNGTVRETRRHPCAADSNKERHAMSRQAMKGIGQVIKANTTEKSIDELRAEGKHRVRVVSSERVMAIIQAIVDDTINSEVGEITSRDRERIVSDTQDRFSRVLQMQQDLEQKVDNLRGSLRDTELQRDSLRADKALLESQLEAARRVDGDADAVARLSRDLSRVRDAVERAPRAAGALDDDALSRVAEKLAARDVHAARRITAEFDDLRTRLEAVGHDASAARDATTEELLQRLKEQQGQAESQIGARMEREFRSVAVCLAEIREEVGRGAGDAITRLQADLDAIENRIHGIETSSPEKADRVAKTLERLAERAATFDEKLLVLRGDLVEVVERAAASIAAPSAEALVHARSEAAKAATAAARAAELQSAHASRLDGAVAELHGEFTALAARIDRSAAVQSDSLETNFKSALEQALDKITRTMERATARPIESNVEATEVLVARMFDVPEHEMSSNLDQLDVEQRRTKSGTAKSVDRLKAMNGLAATNAE